MGCYVEREWTEFTVSVSKAVSVYKELHKEMGHLRTEKVLQLARELFYWHHMQRDITHFVTRVCSCLKQRRPNLPTRAPLSTYCE